MIAAHPPNDGREWDCQCARCGSSVYSQECGTCGGEGFDGHDCGEDVCCCPFPDDNAACAGCAGEAAWWVCMSSEEFCKANPIQGREQIERGAIEWFVIERASGVSNG